MAGELRKRHTDFNLSPPLFPTVPPSHHLLAVIALALLICISLNR